MLRTGRSPIHGVGLFAARPLPKGTDLGAYAEEDGFVERYVAWLLETRCKKRRRRERDPNLHLREQLAFSQYAGRMTFPDLFEPFCEEHFGKAQWARVRRYMVVLGTRTLDVSGESFDVPVLLFGHDTVLGKANSDHVSPNAMLTQEGSLVTVRGVAKGEEITWPYDIVSSAPLPVDA